MFRKFSYLFFFFLFIISCKRESHKAKGDGSSFNELSSKNTGLDFKNQLTDTDSLNIIEYLYYYNGAGVAVGDVNNDGLEDIFFASNQGSDKLFLNKGGLKFEDISSKAGILRDSGWSTGVTIDDINNDGFLDIYVCRVSKFSKSASNHNLLYINNGNSTFTESSKVYGLDFKGYSTQSAFLDYDQDGDLDLYLLNHTVHSVRSYGTSEKRKEFDPLSGDRFFENKLNEPLKKFEDVSANSGIFSSGLGYGLAVTCADLNNDGWTDIYVGNDFHENDYIYLNNGNKTFTEASSKMLSYSTQFSMGADVCDMNNDGLQDIFTTDMLPFDEKVLLVSAGEDSDKVKKIKSDFGFQLQNARNHFQINQGDGTFADIAYLTKTFATDWSWSVLLQDFNCDGNNDIFVTNGIVKRPNDLDYINFLNELDNKNPNQVLNRTQKLIEKMPSQPLKNLLFYQKDKFDFGTVNEAMIGTAGYSTGAAYSDFDNDGDLDIVLNNINSEATLLENKSSGNFIKFRLKDESKKTVKGSKIQLFYKNEVLIRESQTTKGFMSGSSHDVFFGLGERGTPDSIRIIWNANECTTLSNLSSNKTHEVKKSISNCKLWQNKIKEKKPNEDLNVYHEENGFFDENNEPLIPERLGYEGPGLLVADINNDRINDVLIGGARNRPMRLLLGKNDRSFKEVKVPQFDVDAKYEDVDITLFDINNDGLKDIYVVSGGNDNPELDEIMQDRIYLNMGGGVFSRLDISLPHTNGSVARVVDFDNDGFEDIFIGARSIPGYYGLSPYSFLLRNREGKGLDIAWKVRYGMVTDAIWEDINTDGRKDLIIVGDYMPITIVLNTPNGFVEKQNEYISGPKNGFWNTIASTDFNNDGMMDFVIGNAGLNHKWTVSKDKPLHLYVGDFDDNKILEPLIFYHYINRYIPFASLDKLRVQLPVLKKKFNTYQSFAGVSKIEDLFPNYKNKVLEYKFVDELRSIILLSENGKYSIHPLDLEHQMSDINDVLIDGKNLIYIGNRKNYVAELGPGLSNSGGVLSSFDAKNRKFTKFDKLPIENSLNTRRITKLDDERYILCSNESGTFTFSLQ